MHECECACMCVCACACAGSRQGDGGPLSACDESGKIERLITPDAARPSAPANEGYWASIHGWSNIEGHNYNRVLKSLSYL